MWIIDDEFDASLPLPRGERDIPLMIADRSFDKRNQLTDPFAALGRTPRTTASTAAARWSTASTSPTTASAPPATACGSSTPRTFASTTSSSRTAIAMIQIATESGLMPAPVRRRQVLIGPGERVELIVDFAELAGKRVESAERQAPRRAAGSARRPTSAR